MIKGGLIESFAVDQKGQTLWVGTNNQGLYRCGLKSGKCRHVDELADHVYFSLAWDDSEGRLWCGTKTGIVSYDAERREKVTSDSAPAGMTEVRAVLLDHERNALWAGSWFSGLFRYEKTTRQWTQYTEADGLPGETVAALAIDSPKEGRAALWVGTNRGAAKYDFRSGQWQQFNTKDGLAHNFVLTVAVDNSGSVWFGTWGGGVSKYD
jgi:ligand-binding sensor domain-containing protein